ncbi:hypothetical protein CTI12_AA183720 [Artemisia annua]|uniref:Retrotransposon gag domain-containing protein n=1 Tax=Artemisia annua TaxID=35608 RepID=A0A2U1P7T5_ARTAN|nr:hypothetical protein CTI12_AA183720 [Artemisia annua]
MADQRTMQELLQCPTEGYGDAIVLPQILSENFELKTGLIQLVTSNQFQGFERDDPHAHIRWFNKLTSTMKVKDVPHDAIKLMLFPFSLEGAARIWLEKEPPRSITTWEELVSKFVNHFFPPSKTTNLKNDITNFQQRFDESFGEAWERFKDLLRKCPHHGFSELHQIDTFYNALTQNDQDSLNSAAGGNIMNRTPRDILTIIESKSKVPTSRNKPNVSKATLFNPSSSTSSAQPSELAALTDAVHLMMKEFKNQGQKPEQVKAVNESCVICGGPHPYYNCQATDGQAGYADVAAANFNYNQGFRPNNQMGPPGFPPVPNNQNRYNQNRATSFNQNQGYQTYHNSPPKQPFNQQPPTRPSSPELAKYMKTNDVSMRAMQNQIDNLKGEVKKEIDASISQHTNELKQMMSTFIQMNQPSSSNSLPSNTIHNPRGDLKAITTRSGVSYKEPTIPTTSYNTPSKVVDRATEVTTDTEIPTYPGRTETIQPPVVQTTNENVSKGKEKVVFEQNEPVKTSLPYPSRLNEQKRQDKNDYLKEKFFKMFQEIRFDISLADAVVLMPKFSSMLKNMLNNNNKDKLYEQTTTPLNANCSAVLLKKIPEKLEDPGKFIIPCDFSGMIQCSALADLGASINMMPLSIWKQLSLPPLTPTRMTLELADRSTSFPKGIAEDVIVKVGKFYFPADFVVVDFDPDPKVPLILGRGFLKTGRASINVYDAEITLRDGHEAVTFNLNQTARYSSANEPMTVSKIDIVDEVDELSAEYSQEVLGFSSGNPTSSSSSTTSHNSPYLPSIDDSPPIPQPIIADSSPSFTPFEGGDFLFMEEVDEFLSVDTSSFIGNIGDSYYDPEGDVFMLEQLLDKDPFSSLPPKKPFVEEVKQVEQSEEKLPKLELKELPPHLEYAFLEGTDKLPVIISKHLQDEEKKRLVDMLKKHKDAIAWRISDIKGIDPRFCTHKILLENDAKPSVQPQRRVNPKIHEVIKNEVIKLLDAGMIYPISDSPWVSPVHCVPKKGGMTVVTNDDDELIPTRLVTGWRVCIDYRKLNEATRKDHFPLPFMDQMIERLAGNEFYCFLDGFSGYFQIPIDPPDQFIYLYFVDLRNRITKFSFTNFSFIVFYLFQWCRFKT